MHGMLSAAILIGVFAVIAAVCLYMVVRVYSAGRARAHGQAPGPRGVQTQAQEPAMPEQAGHHGDAS